MLFSELRDGWLCQVPYMTKYLRHQPDGEPSHPYLPVDGNVKAAQHLYTATPAGTSLNGITYYLRVSYTPSQLQGMAQIPALVPPPPLFLRAPRSLSRARSTQVSWESILPPGEWRVFLLLYTPCLGSCSALAQVLRYDSHLRKTDINSVDPSGSRLPAHQDSCSYSISSNHTRF
jgi:hypothetical protein